VCSRCVVGLVVTLEAPSATSVGLCLAHMATDKRAWLERLGVEAVWPTSGKPHELYMDNAAEFKSEALRRGCDQHGIGLSYRPPGQPHFGGIIERLIGTMMRMVHDEVPGTTFSNTAQRGSYDSDGKAVLTLTELQAWLALATAYYHGQVHESLGRTPAGVWAEKVAEAGAPVTVTNPTAFLVNFLPVIRRTLSRTGFQIDHVQYYLRRAQAVDRPPGTAGEVRVAPGSARHQSDLGAGPGRYRLPGGGLPDAVPSADQRVGAAGHRRPTARAGPGRGRRERPVRDGEADAPDHRHRRGQHPQGPPRPTAAVGDTGPAAPNRAASAAGGREHRCGGQAVRGDRAVVTSTDTHFDIEDGPVDLSHLNPTAQRIARLPDEERLRYVRADRWIGYPRATAALERLETLFSWPSNQRMPNLLLIDPTNNGKSMITEKFRRAHPPVSHEDAEEIPVLVVQMPSEPSVTPVLHRAAGRPRRADAHAVPDRRAGAARAAAAAGGLGAHAGDRRAAQCARRAGRHQAGVSEPAAVSGQRAAHPLVGVGIRDAYLAIRADDQLENRFAPLTLPRWEPDDDTCSLLASFAASFPLRRPSPIANPEMASYLLTRSEGTIGELAHLLTDAAVAAIESGEEAINQRTLLLAPYEGPTERRRLFERELA